MLLDAGQRALMESIIESYVWCGMTAVDDCWCECGYCQQGAFTPFEIEHATDCRCLKELLAVGGNNGTEQP